MIIAVIRVDEVGVVKRGGVGPGICRFERDVVGPAARPALDRVVGQCNIAVNS